MQTSNYFFNDCMQNLNVVYFAQQLHCCTAVAVGICILIFLNASVIKQSANLPKTLPCFYTFKLLRKFRVILKKLKVNVAYF